MGKARRCQLHLIILRTQPQTSRFVPFCYIAIASQPLRYISTGIGIKLRNNESFSPPFHQGHNTTTTTTTPTVLPLPSLTVSRQDHRMMDEYIIDAWMHRGDGEDDDAYEGRMNLGPPNNVAAALEREDQRAASATTPLPISANKESVCAAGRLCNAPDHADLNSLTHRCLNCRGKIHSALWCGKNLGGVCQVGYLLDHSRPALCHREGNDQQK
jgi:hypothetical protein